MKTFRVLSAVLMYPEVELQEAIPELKAVLEEERLLKPAELQAVGLLLDRLETGGLLDLQEEYVLLFDRTRSLSLHLFEHVHGQSRDRGQAMVDLRQQYLETGVDMVSSELPDFLPMFLEYLSMLPVKQARKQLNLCLPIIAAIRERLRKRGSAYSAAFGALTGIAGGKPDPEVLHTLLSLAEDNPEDMSAVDQAWEESPVSFRPDFLVPETSGTTEIPIRVMPRQPSNS
ncbi:MAG: nitrate reductase molybdenum cofactor assembly chaperone [Gammaproteobacteria bacterium]|nr:nitrate reductase molybdenum cofactor assembly chaperone [Gammaproteobacteria bacterium]MYD75925.1 nitrate reductase molybdenum cofactor assembly chaperone [Gammaproteobacteria bacterium]MYJ51820.1 nitrate reductase molybdenum cofactor assembly chaperone [Gammaproteobacteria bacterium]